MNISDYFRRYHENEFEGRCHKCKVKLAMTVEVVDQFTVLLRLDPCAINGHDKFSEILIPKRSDLHR
jgi:hypothetical protein